MVAEKKSIYVANTETCQNFNGISMLEDYAKKQEKQIFVLSSPLIDNRYHSNYDNGIIIASPGHKILFVSLNNNINDDSFLYYIDDTLEDIGSISDRYHFKDKIGRPRSWKGNVIDKVTSSDFLKHKCQLEEYIVSDPTEKRRVNIIISFLIGSINNASNIDVEAPNNILESVKQKIQLFDCDQTRFIYDEGPKEKKTIRIQGMSGTGKTELLLHKLKDIYISNKSSMVAFTCFSKVLASSLRRRIPQFFDNMNVEQQIAWNERLFCFSSWGQKYDSNSGLYSYICDKYHIDFHAYKDDTDFEKVCKIAYDEIKQKKEDQDSFEYAFQYLFIDESQDFRPNFFELCELFTEYRVFAAGDIFQDIFETLEDSEKVERDYLLSRCYRTDPKLFMIAQGLGWGLFEEEKLRWLSDDAWKVCGYNVSIKGNEYSLSRENLLRFDNFKDPKECFNAIFADDISDTSSEVIDIIKNLKTEFPELSPNDVCVIYIDDSQYIYNSVSLLKQQLYIQLEWEANIAYESKRKIDNTVFVSNRKNAKGLEFPFVICVTKKINNLIHYRNSLYTMLSRAFLRTYMIMSRSYEEEYNKEIKKGIENVLSTGSIKTEKPQEEQIQLMKQRLLEFKQTRSLAERIEAALLFLELPVDNISSVLKYADKSKKKFDNEQELQNFIKNLVNAGLIDE